MYNSAAVQKKATDREAGRAVPAKSRDCTEKDTTDRGYYGSLGGRVG